MATFIDRRLRDQLARAGEHNQVEAVIVVDADPDLSTTGSVRKCLEQVIEGAIGRAGEHPATVRYFAGANASVILASGRFIREILEDEHIAVASATDVDVIAFYS
jgi:hypothetical protein